MRTMIKKGRQLRNLGFAVLLMSAPALALAQHGGDDGGSGTGDVFGDLVHIKRSPTTGQPILQKRWIEMPGDTFGWGYCPIPLNGAGEEVGFVDLSCDPADPLAVVEVNYFGRLSGGRTKERNSRMHFDEVIATIKDPAVGTVSQDAVGRLQFGYDCTGIYPQQVQCASWKVIDSPMENLALYARLMRYGHLQTDPAEVDTFAHGDPAAGTQYHPALAAGDYEKFDQSTRHLLPEINPSLCFPADGSFDAACAAGKRLTSNDFVRAGSFLAGAADKTGVITVDLVQYMNRILKITLNTELSTANVRTLPALIRDCGGGDGVPYLPIEQCTTLPATAGLPAPANERFVDFFATNYVRNQWHDYLLEVLKPLGGGMWQEVDDVRLMDWLSDQNGPQPLESVRNVDGFVAAASDGLRSIEFIHNYEIPADLWDFVLDTPSP
jgi:hypothetical protein